MTVLRDNNFTELMREGGVISIQSMLAALNTVSYASGVNFAAYPTANTAIYIPFRTAVPLIATAMYIHNGATVSGNFDLGIYTDDGTRLVSSGSTAQSGISTLQVVDITDTLLGSGLVFYMAVSFDNTTATVGKIAISAVRGRVVGIAEEASAFALPATATFAVFTQTMAPHIGITTRGTLV